MSHLHIGVRNQAAVEVIKELLPPGKATTDGDQWEAWGEKPTPEDPSLHVVITGDSVELLADLAWLMDQAPLTLVPMMGEEFQKGTVACITPEDDWSEPYFTITNTRVQRGLKPEPRRVKITVTETVTYSKEYDLEELEEFAGIALGEGCGDDLSILIEEVHEMAHSGGDGGGFAAELERHGDVQGQTWTGEFVR